MTAAPPPGIRVAGDTHVGKVRTTNEDALVVDPMRGLYAVLDGMGGANAGDVASQMARDAIVRFVGERRSSTAPRQLLEGALQAGSAAVYQGAQAHRERQGMGTTVVACLMVDPSKLIIAHVGDSRAYLLRQGRLQSLTRDHTIVEELVDRGLLTPDEAERHPYKNVLSRNLGARPETRVDVVELELKPGDRLLLCSDGLYGYAAVEAIQYLLGSGDAPEHVARDLIELALRGGGGDNVSAIVIEAPAAPPTTTQVVRTNGAAAWWQQRTRFLQIAKDRGLPRNPLVRGIDATEALELVALSMCQAIFHDLEKSTGVNVWTFAQNLATGWFERGGEWAPVRAMMDILSTSARVCVDEVRTRDHQLGYLLDIAVGRSFVVAELALGGLLSDQLRKVDSELIEQTAQHETIEGLGFDPAPTMVPVRSDTETAASGPPSRPSNDAIWVDRPTIPFLRPDRPVSHSGASGELLEAVGKAIVIALARTSPRAELTKDILRALEAIVGDLAAAELGAAVLAARELYGVRPVDDTGIMPLFDALESARVAATASIHQVQVGETQRAKLLQTVSCAHQRLVSATTGLVLEAASPFGDRLREVQAVTAQLRDQVASAEQRRAALERKHASKVDSSLPWGSRGVTEW